MATLTQTSITARKVIRYGIYAVILIIIARFSYRTAASIYRRLFPPPPEPPKLEFGRLPVLPHPQETFPENLTYKLETQDGQLPEMPQQYHVFVMPPESSSINVEDEARAKAQKLGFEPDGKPVVESVPNIYVFNKTNSPATLTMNIVTKVFSVNYDLDADPTALGSIPPTKEAAISFVENFLNRAGLLEDDLKNGVYTHDYYKVEGGEFAKALSQSEADVIKLNLYRAPYKETPSVTPDFPIESNIWFMLSRTQRGQTQIIGGEYHYYPVEVNKSSTYPLRGINEAWEDLKSGKGFITNVGDNQGEVVIRKVYLAYYDPGQYTEFYQPVFVFEGDGRFAAVVPAISKEQIASEEE
jgi:hypothetical protein